ncbi:MAG: hypothetical protein HRT47_13370 [Candidatus Caenarcaniphilales bacterium]|nr:hypothetical protein [Candidatus Caenarcaniphilales bacterium]
MAAISTQVQNQPLSLNQELKERALSIYIDTLSGLTTKHLEESQDLRNFVKEYQDKWGFHLHLKNGIELDPCDGHHGHEEVKQENASPCGDETCCPSEVKALHAEEEVNTQTKPIAETKNSQETKKGFLETVIDGISNNDSIPKAIKPILMRGSINMANIFLAQGLSAPLHHIHTPTEITSTSAVTGMHLMNYGAKKWESLAKNLLTIVPFVALHRVVKVPNFVMRSALGFAISLTEQLSGGDKEKSTMDKFKDAFSKDASKFLFKVAQIETMLNTAIPLGQSIAKNIPNKALAFISQSLAMVGAFTIIPEIFNFFKPQSDKPSRQDLDNTALTAELLECPVCGEAHGADVHMAEISEGISAAGASNASNHHNLHSVIHDHGGALA